MCGVYDIEKHYEFERGRDVHEISSMKRAMGGHDKFFEQSPFCILRELFHSPHLTVHGFNRSHLKRLPPILLMSSEIDNVVPR